MPEGLHLVPSPPASPALPRAERLWPSVNEPVDNCTFADLDALEDALVARCRALRADRRTIRDLTHLWRWPPEQPTGNHN